MSADNLMSDAVMVPRADPDSIWLEPSCCADPSHGRQWCEDDAFPVCEDGREPVKYIRADLAASTPVGGWEADRDAVAEAVHKGRFPDDREPTPFADEDRSGREYCYRIADRVLALAPPPPSVSTGSRPQEAVPTELGVQWVLGLSDAVLLEASMTATEALIDPEEDDYFSNRTREAIARVRANPTGEEAMKGIRPVRLLLDKIIEAATESQANAPTTHPVKTGEG